MTLRNGGAVVSALTVVVVIVLAIVSASIHALGASRDSAARSNLRTVATYARAHEEVKKDAPAVTPRWKQPQLMANTINNFLHSADNIYGATSYPVFDVYAAAGTAPLVHEAAESVEIDTAASSAGRLVLRSRSQTGNEYQLTEAPAGPAEIVKTKTTGYIGQGHGALLGEEAGFLAAFLAVLWSLLLAYGALGRRRIARSRRTDALSEWRRYVPEGTGPAKPVEGYRLLVPEKLIHTERATAEVEVEFTVLDRCFQQGRWVGTASHSVSKEIWDGETRWSADTPFEQLADAWIGFLSAVSRANDALHGNSIELEANKPSLEEILEQRLRTVALLETPQEMAVRQQPPKRALLCRR